MVDTHPLSTKILAGSKIAHGAATRKRNATAAKAAATRKKNKKAQANVNRPSGNVSERDAEHAPLGESSCVLAARIAISVLAQGLLLELGTSFQGSLSTTPQIVQSQRGMGVRHRIKLAVRHDNS